MILKKGVSVDGCGAEILRAAITIIDPLFSEYGHDGIVTSGSEHFKHSAKRSAHYRGDALDWRSNWYSLPEKYDILDKLKERLGGDFVVILESVGKPYEHFHIHWSPVYGK